MTRKTLLAERLETAGMNAELDAACKGLVANKIVLAWIMKYSLREYSDFDVNTIAEHFIEGEPVVSGIAVHQDEMFICGESTQDDSMTEGTVVYDIRFRAIAPYGDGYTSLIINVEAQNNFYPGYPLIKRGLYHCWRMISGQYGTDLWTRIMKKSIRYIRFGFALIPLNIDAIV